MTTELVIAVALTFVPATLIVPDLAAPVLAPAVKVTLAEPVPEDALVATQPVVFVTDHAQSAVVLTLTVKDSPELSNDKLVGATV